MGAFGAWKAQQADEYAAENVRLRQSVISLTNLLKIAVEATRMIIIDTTPTDTDETAQGAD